jgi:hypothetical protein
MVVTAPFAATSANLWNLDGTAKSPATFNMGCTVHSTFGISDSNVLYILCSGGGPVRKFNDGVPPTFLESITLTGQTTSTYAFNVAPNGDMWAVQGTNVIRKYSSTGAFLLTFPWPGINDVHSLVVDQNNNLWGTAVSGPVRQYSPSGTLLQTLSDPGDGFSLLLAGGPLPSQRNPFTGVFVADTTPNPDQVTLFTGSSCAPTKNPTTNPTKNPTENPV